MGKGRKCKTTWRRVPWEIDEHSDNSEEFETSTTTNSSARLHQKSGPYAKNGYSGTYGRYNSSTYSSQSTPTRRYQYENGTKSTRSSSTASENKITFNEDEYTRINTPRQDVLFKKGYLNKPKTYQTQTSTGNSTTSTGNSTGNGTPDHQSADLELESQFHFPNGYIDQNGIYFLNSYEPLPVMFSYQPTYYHEFSDVKSKRYSTGSLTESTSPTNEEASQEETTTTTTTPSNASAEFNNHNHHNGYINHVVYNHHQEYYYNGTSQAQESTEKSEPRPVKKKKRRKTTSHEATASTNSEEDDEDEEQESSDEVFSTIPNNAQEEEKEEGGEEDRPQDAQKLLMDSLVVSTTGSSASSETVPDETVQRGPPQNDDDKDAAPKSDLKPDAEEFVPRLFYPHQQQETIPMDPMQFIKIPPNFVPVPMIGPSGEYPAFIPAPTGIFVPHQNYFVPTNVTYQRNEDEEVEEKVAEAAAAAEEENKQEVEEKPVEVPKTVAIAPLLTPPKQIDIAKIVSKLEEAAKEQDEEDKPNGQKPKRQNYRRFRSLTEKPRRFKPRQREEPGLNQKAAEAGTCQTKPAEVSSESRTSDSLRFSDSLRSSHPLRSSDSLKPSDSFRSPDSLRSSDSTRPAESRILIQKSSEARSTQVKPPEPRATQVKPLESRHPVSRSFELKPAEVRSKAPDRSSEARLVEARAPEARASEQRSSETRAFAKNYSETLRKRDVRDDRTRTKLVVKTTPKASPVKEPLPQKLPNQWISVSSKKKRKNRNVEEFDDFEQMDKEKDEFESYDVTLLQDVVVASEVSSVEKDCKVEDQIKEQIEEYVVIAALEAVERVQKEQSKERVQGEQNKEIFAQVEQSIEIQVKEVEARIDEDEQEKPKPKKTKKKTITKRVMITDIDLSQDFVEPKVVEAKVVEPKVVEAKVAEPKVVEAKVVEPKVEPEAVKVTPPEPLVEVVTETQVMKEQIRKSPEKKPKSKKKKKKQSSVEPLPEEQVAVSDQEKTNVEISQELDMLIKKRMFNSFDSQMVEIKDDFFKSIMSNISREPSVEKNVLKTPDFSRIFTNTLLKPKPPPTILEPCSSNSSNGHFLAEGTPAPGGVDNQEPSSQELIQNESKGEKLYPITQAVKEWMTKTRENTPEVEILKSPSTIIKEFGLSEEVHDEKEEQDEEVTVWSKESSVDLLECWEDEIETVKAEPVEQGEDVLEVYESAYGQNDDYKRIKAEIETKQQSFNSSFPKHGNLPYRAICCSIM